MTSEIAAAAALYASKWLASLLHLSYRERLCVCMGWEEEVLESTNLRILCEVWISAHRSWAGLLVGFALNFLGFWADPIRYMIICLYKIIKKKIISLEGFCICNN